MKKLILLLVSFSILSNVTAIAVPPPPPNHNCCHSEYPYIRSQWITETEVPIENCNKHFIEVQTIVTDYSDNNKLTTQRYTAYDNYGNIITNNCMDMEHIVFNNKCYFIIKFYEAEFLGSDSIKTAILSADNNFKITTKYTSFQKIGENKYLVRNNGLYGIIDIDENEIIPIKYNTLEKMSYGIYRTSMNNAFGVISMDGETILPCIYNKIKRLGTYYYQVKQDNKWGIISGNGTIIAPVKYKDVKISKNILYVKEFGGDWVKLMPGD